MRPRAGRRKAEQEAAFRQTLLSSCPQDPGLTGRLVVTQAETPTEIAAGDYVVLAAEAPHSLTCLEAARILIYTASWATHRKRIDGSLP